MPIQTFIGLSILIVALMVASVPQLLEPTAASVEKLAIQAGALPKPKKAAAPAKDADAAAAAEGSAAGVLALRGRVSEETGDLRDTLELEAREAAGTHRLAKGSQRRLLPGQPERDRRPPVSEDGFLLDSTGCPYVRPGTTMADVAADPELLDPYEAKVDAAEDPEACEMTFLTRVGELSEFPRTIDGTLDRDSAMIRRGGPIAMLVALREVELLESMLGEDVLADAVAATR